MICKAGPRNKLKEVMDKRRICSGYTWNLRKKSATKNKAPIKGGLLAKGYKPDPSSEEDNSESEDEVKNVAMKSKKGGKKKASMEKAHGCKPTITKKAPRKEGLSKGFNPYPSSEEDSSESEDEVEKVAMKGKWERRRKPLPE